MNHHDRIHPRVTASTRVDWCVAGGATHVVSNLANVSSGGAFVRTCIPAPVGASVDICLLTEIGDIPASGRVAWTSPTGMGIAFHG